MPDATTKPRIRRNRWNIRQIAEKLDALSRDLRAIAEATRAMRAPAAALRAHETPEGLRKYQREGVGYLRDMALMLTHEMSTSEAANSQAAELCRLADKLQAWSDHPTDKTGSDQRAACLYGAAQTIIDWAEQLR